MALSYKVFPGTPYYSNTTLTTKAGEIVNTTDATYVNTTYGTVSVGGSTYYVAYGMMVSFWNSSFNGQQIEDAITKVRAASATPASGGTDLFTTGGAYALKTAAAAKADLTSIIQTGTTCTEANGIAAGVYFYLNGDLVCAKTAIANGVTFTLNTNYEVPTAGALNALKSALNAWEVVEHSITAPTGAETHLTVEKNGILKRGRISGYISKINLTGGSYVAIRTPFQNSWPLSDTALSAFSSGSIVNAYAAKNSGTLVVYAQTSASNENVWVSGEWNI